MVTAWIKCMGPMRLHESYAHDAGPISGAFLELEFFLT